MSKDNDNGRPGGPSQAEPVVSALRASVPDAKPVRVQLSRRKGWRMPENTVKVDRSTKWGNPHNWRDWIEQWPFPGLYSGEVGRDNWCRQLAVMAFEEDLRHGEISLPVHELRGKNLACWCPPKADCHADVLLELANADAPEGCLS